MKIAIYGAGAIGALLGAKLHLSGEDVTLIARGPHLQAMQKSGVTVIESGETYISHPSLAENPKDIGPVDYLFITVKTNGLEAIAENIKQDLISRIPMAKLGKAEDVSNCVAFLSSDLASYVTGETIHVNGGMYMS